MDTSPEIITSGERGPVAEAPMQVLEGGAQVAAGPGWFVTSLEHATWWGSDRIATACFETPDVPMRQYGINVRVVQPGHRSCMYHREFHEDESFLVLDGSGTLIVEGEERAVRAGDFVHCPAGTAHVFANSGVGPLAILAVGARGHLPEGEPELVYEVDEAAARHGASVPVATTRPDEAYAADPDARLVPAPWSPGAPE